MPSPSPILNTKSADFNWLVAQLAHFGWGGLIIVNCWLWRGDFWIGFAVLAGWVAAKEFVFDLIVEDDGIVNGVIDGAFYFAGAIMQFWFLTRLTVW